MRGLADALIQRPGRRSPVSVETWPGALLIVIHGGGAINC